MGYKVIKPLVITKDAAGKDVYLYQDAPVPEGLQVGEVERLLEGEFIADEKDADKQPAKKAAPAKSDN
jgi:hypothetical protein